MFRKINVLALLVLLLSQTILVPVAPINLVSAEGGNNESELEQTEVDAAEEALIDKTALSTLLEDIDELDLEADIYTEASFQPFIDAIETGEEILIDEEVTEEQVAEAVEDIEEAFDNLEEVEKEEASEDEETTEQESMKDEDKKQADKGTEENENVTEEKAEEEKNANTKSKAKKSQTAIQPFHHDGHEGFTVQISEVKDLNGNPYDENNPIKPDSEFFIQLEWILAANHNYQEGHQEMVQLPKEIEINEPIKGGELKDEFGNLVATYDVDINGEVTLTFTDFVENNSDVKGWVQIRAQLDQDNLEEEDGKVIINPIGEEGKIEIPIDRGEVNKTIDKQGKPNREYNAEEIEWTVVINKNGHVLQDVSGEDLLPEGTEYIDGSIKVTKQQVSINGTPVGNVEEVSVTPSVDGGKLIIPLGDIKDMYTITYTTSVTDMDEKNFKNQAVFKDKNLEDVAADSTVTINRGEPLHKGAVNGSNSYDPKTGIIEWYLEFNYNQKNLVDVTLSDNWTPAGKVELVGDSVKFQEVEIDENGKAHKVGDPVAPDKIGASLKKTDNGFEISDITTDKPYYIVYETKVKDRVVDNEGFRIENKASFGDHEYDEGYDIRQKVGEKSAGNVDYQNKTIEWQIKVNSDERQMNDVIIEDTLGEGLTLIADSIKMTIDGQEKTDFVLEDATANPFKLTNIGDTDKEIIVIYKTKYVADELPDNKAKNKANISWIPEDSDERIELEVEAERQLNKETADSSWKNGTYNPDTKEITWTIIANYRENAYDDFKITDTPQGNQKLLADTIEVYELTVNADGSLPDGDKVDVTPVISDNTFTLNVG